ncbi:HNH endonuclease [Salmonella enterica]|nr:HNH endonuclease [Salmonella enterica]EBA9765538.1 HNH endonuclease [Salmonella enterica]EEB5699291.1 HNH endonuclease [Salmonella enterica]EGX5144525.1 HNH endonuclease [Salmonella enterica]ELF4900202.1 HNH endonuclease [Salmonella enterica]
MPPGTPRACRKSGCRKTTTDRSGYCDEHRCSGWERWQPGKSKQQRGYGGNWPSIRLRILQRDKYLCQSCLRQGIATSATSVDHIIPKSHGGTDNDSNLEAICRDCHSTKTARERLR